MERGTAMRKMMILALAALAAMPAHAQENLADRVFEVKDKSGKPLLQITNIQTKPTFGAILQNVSGAKLDMPRESTLYMTYTSNGKSEKVWIILCHSGTGVRCEIPDKEHRYIDVATFLPAVLNSVDFGLSDFWQEDTEAKAKAKIEADEAAAKTEAENKKIWAARHEAWEKEVAIEEAAEAAEAKRKAPAEAAEGKRKAAAKAAEAKRKAAADAAEANRKTAAEAIEAKQKAAAEAAEAAKLAKLKTACVTIYRATVDEKVSDLTVRETEQVKACQMLGLYSE
jgi:hypothetical protein